MARPALQLGLIGDPQGWHLSDLARAGEARGHAVTAVPWTSLASQITDHNERLSPAVTTAPTAFVIRGMPRGGLEEVVFRMNAVARLEAAGHLVVNPARSLEIAIDKYLTTARLADHGLPVPKTVVAQEAAAIRNGWEWLGGDVVAKPLFGSGGRGLERIRSRTDLESFLARQPAERPAYLQEFVPHPDGDLRILVVGDRAFAIRRRSDDWRTNVSLGGSAELLEPSPEMRDLATRAAAATGTVVAGIDLLPTAEGRLLVLEVNAVPGWRALSATCGVDIAAEVIALLERQMPPPGERPSGNEATGGARQTPGKRDSGELPPF